MALRFTLHGSCVQHGAPSEPWNFMTSKFTSTQARLCIRDHHTFARLMFALQNALAMGNNIPQWTLHAQLHRMCTWFLTSRPVWYRHNITVVLMTCSRQHITISLILCHQSHGSSLQDYDMQTALPSSENLLKPSETFANRPECLWSDSTLHGTIQMCQKILTIL